jgi:hypothetical protein
MVDSGDNWATLLDFDEAVCYALVRAQCTGFKYKIQASTMTRGGWHASEQTGVRAKGTKSEAQFSKRPPRFQRAD